MMVLNYCWMEMLSLSGVWVIMSIMGVPPKSFLAWDADDLPGGRRKLRPNHYVIWTFLFLLVSPVHQPPDQTDSYYGISDMNTYSLYWKQVKMFSHLFPSTQNVCLFFSKQKCPTCFMLINFGQSCVHSACPSLYFPQPYESFLRWGIQSFQMWTHSAFI